MSEDVNEDEEVYTDGTSITNITVAGVKDKIAMFAGGAKPGVASKPVPAVLQRFQEKAAEAGQTNFNSFGKPAEGGSPGGRAFGKPAADAKTNGGPPAPAQKPKTFGGKTPSTGSSSSPSSSAPSSYLRGKSSETNTDQNQNVTKKRGSLNIPGVFQQNSTQPSTERRVSVDEKPSVQNGPLPKSPSSESPVSSKPTESKADADSGTKIDFRANLRPTATRGSGPPKPIEIHPRQRTPSQDDKTVLPPGSENSFKSKATSPTSPTSFSPPKRITRTKSVITRMDDGKKFERVAKGAIITQDLAPIKPLKPKDINVRDIIEEFRKAYDDFKYANEELYDDVGNFIRPEEEEYDDVSNTISNTASQRKSNRPVSEIPEMTEEEEFGSGGSTSASASASGSGGSAAVLVPPVEEMYDEGIPAEPEELYEPLPDEDMEGVDSPTVDKKELERKEKEAAEKRKREEKERKEREKREKQEQAKREKEEKAKQKEKEKKEKEERELRKKLKLTGEEQTEAQGVVKERAKGGKLDLAVQAGDKVDIIRMTDNPKGRWLVKNTEGAYGYVESDNILIETPTIKQQTEGLASKVKAMKLVDNPHAEGDVGNL